MHVTDTHLVNTLHHPCKSECLLHIRDSKARYTGGLVQSRAINDYSLTWPQSTRAHLVNVGLNVIKRGKLKDWRDTAIIFVQICYCCYGDLCHS